VAGYQPLDLDPTDAFPPDAIYGIDLAGSTLVYANGIDGVTTASVGDPTEPRPMATYAAYDAREIAFDGDWIFVLLGEHQGRLMIFDTGGTNSAQMESTFGDLSHLFLADEHLYVTSHNYVGILDVTDPLHPTVVHEWEPPESTGNPATAFVADGVAYFGAGWGGLYLFDVTDPAAPVALSHWPSPDWVTGLTVADGTAYVALGSTGLAILDVGDPQHPELLGLAELPGFASRAVVAHGHAFVGWFGESGTLGGIAVVDVRDPAEPVLRDTYGRLQSIAGLEIIGDHLIVADEAQGLIVFEIRGHDS
jgi:hypothetical protein